MRVYRSTFSENCEKLLPLFQEHWTEIGLLGTKNLDLKLNNELYRTLEAANHYLAICLDTDEGETIGYLSIIIFPHHHHGDTMFATTDCFFVRKKNRSIKTYKAVCQMFTTAINILKSEHGVKYMQMGFSVNNDLSKLATKLGFVKSEVMFVREI